MIQKRESPFKGKVAIAAKIQLEREKEENKKKFAELYQAKKEYIFPQPEEIKLTKHFYFPKIISLGRLSLKALSIYPVLCLQADFKKDEWFQISQENIAKRAGLSVSTVTKAIDELSNCRVSEEFLPLLEKKIINQGSVRLYLYKVFFIRKQLMEEWENQYFVFHQCIVDSAVWADLKPRAKVLYLIMRQQAHFDKVLYFELEELGFLGEEVNFNFYDDYRNRKWDLCSDSIARLSSLSHISVSGIQETIKQLEYHRLVERIGSAFKVYLQPKIRQKVIDKANAG